MPACAVCTHAEHAAIDAALDKRESHRAIAARFGVTPSSVFRHSKHREAKQSKPAKRKPPSPKRGSQSRARADEAVEVDLTGWPTTPEERTLFVMRLMATGLWDTGRTGRQIAKATSLSEHTIARIASEASRRCKAAVDAELVRSRLAIALDEGCEIGLEMARSKTIVDEETGLTTKVEGDPRGLSGLASCAKAFAPLVGANREAVTSVVVNIAADPTFQQITRTIFEALAPFPEAKRAVMLRLRTAVSERQAEAKLLGS